MALILADTSVWVAHFHSANPKLQALLEADQALCHPMVVLEIACGTPPSPRARTLADLQKLRQAMVATTAETLDLVTRERLYDSGCGAVDVALLAATLLTPGARLWTLDKKLSALAKRLGVGFDANQR